VTRFWNFADGKVLPLCDARHLGGPVSGRDDARVTGAPADDAHVLAHRDHHLRSRPDVAAVDCSDLAGGQDIDAP
jgi:hypothetical protein